MSYFLFKLPLLAKHLSKYYLENKNGEYFTSNVNEVIRSVLSLYFFLRKDFARTKSTKAQRRNQTKAQNATSEQK